MRYNQTPLRFFPVLLVGCALVLLSACHEPANPLLGSWRHTSPDASGKYEIMTFTPSTMVIGDRRVTVVYQIRPDKIRVSASGHAIIYDLVDEQTIRYEDEKTGPVVLKRIPDDL
jgi:hypothetical protein